MTESPAFAELSYSAIEMTEGVVKSYLKRLQIENTWGWRRVTA